MTTGTFERDDEHGARDDEGEPRNQDGFGPVAAGSSGWFAH